MAYNKNDFLAGVASGRALHGRHIGANGFPVKVSGTIDIAANGTFDVTNYAQANVQVPHKQFTVGQILDGTIIGVPNLSAGITIYSYLGIENLSETFIDWGFILRFISYYVPQEDNEFMGFLIPPVNAVLPSSDGGKTRLVLPSLDGEYYGEYTYSINKDMTDCGVLIEESNEQIVGGVGFPLHTDKLYRMSLIGDGWRSREMYLVFDMLIRKHVMLEE